MDDGLRLYDEIVWPGSWRPPGEEYETPFFDVLRAEGRRFAEALQEKRRAGERDRREWLEGVSRRLGLVAEVHRCRVWKRGEGDWAARCLRPGCPAGRGVGWAPSQQYALGDALAHAGAFLPLPVVDDEPADELGWAGYVPLLNALPWRVADGE